MQCRIMPKIFAFLFQNTGVFADDYGQRSRKTLRKFV